MIPFAKISRSLLGLLAFASFAVSGERPFPQTENGKVKLIASESPYLLEQGVVFSARDTLSIEPGVTVLMGEYAKIMFRGSLKISGTEEKPVVFKSVDSTKSWNGIHFTSMARPFEVKHFHVENAFRNSVFRSQGVFEDVHFDNNYYGLWLDESPKVKLENCEFSGNRFALSVRAGQVVATDTKIANNVHGLYIESGGRFDGDMSLISNNTEADVRNEAEEMAGQGRKVNRSIWQHLEIAF